MIVLYTYFLFTHNLGAGLRSETSKYYKAEIMEKLI